MATVDDVRRIALSLPETDEHPSYGGSALVPRAQEGLLLRAR